MRPAGKVACEYPGDDMGMVDQPEGVVKRGGLPLRIERFQLVEKIAVRPGVIAEEFP